MARITNKIPVGQKINRSVTFDEFKKLYEDGTLDLDEFIKNIDEFNDAISECDATTQGKIKALIYSHQHPVSNEVKELQKKLEAQKKAKEAAEDRAIEAEKNVEKLKKQLADAEVKATEAEKASKEAETKATEAEKAKAEADKKLADAAVQIAAAASNEAKAQEAEEKLADAEAEIKKAKDDLAARDAQIADLEQKLLNAGKQPTKSTSAPITISSIFGNANPMNTRSSRDGSTSEQFLYYKDNEDEAIDADIAKALIAAFPKLFKKGDFTWWYVLTAGDGTIVRDEPSKIPFKA